MPVISAVNQQQNTYFHYKTTSVIQKIILVSQINNSFFAKIICGFEGIFSGFGGIIRGFGGIIATFLRVKE